MQIDSCGFLCPESEANSLRPVSGETRTRRQFLQAAAAVGAMAAVSGKLGAASPASAVRWPKLKGSPVLDSLHPVIEHSRDVHTHVEKIVEVAGWMAYEELPMPEYQIPFGVGQGSTDDVLDFILTADSVDTAFTDFSTHVKFQVDYAGRHWSDSDALFACMKRAMDDGFSILDGKFLASLTRPQLERIFSGNIEMPMLDEKLQVWRQVGLVLAEKYARRFHNFVKSCSPRLYDNGAGLIDRLVKEFPRFDDVSPYDGETIKIYKLPQLGIWLAYSALKKGGQLAVEDIDKMTAFADYIVPVALRLLGITSYSPELEHAINTYQIIPRDSRWEVEIRAHCIYATALLTEEINNIRPKDQQIIIPQIDARLWTHYHTTQWPHHLTKTIMY
jgi:Potential Queuosine, Q, salvage protein family/TAT (twin-arginine translocation) pathway signal sequence